MKSLFLSIALLLIISVLSAQTTQEEYNYVTKGYKVQIESGLDMKKGYEFTDVDDVKQNAPNGNSILRHAWLKALYRISNTNTKTIAAYMIVYQKSGSPTEYMCIPAPNSSEEIRNAYFKALYPNYGDHSERLQVITFLLSRSLKW